MPATRVVRVERRGAVDQRHHRADVLTEIGQRMGGFYQNELAGKGVRVQAALPGAIATEFWDIARLPVSNLRSGTVMSAEDLVDAALAGLDQGEIVTIPSLPDVAEWIAFETARPVMSGRLSAAVPWYPALRSADGLTLPARKDRHVIAGGDLMTTCSAV